ncbi:hypothetical protein KQI65_07540 [bacterium]|nr:hypothetical protein [bacterium]
MTVASKHALTASILWSLIFLFLIIIVFRGGIEHFDSAENSIWRLAAAAVILPGFIFNAWLGWRSKKGRREGEIDERDDAIALAASRITLVVVALAVYFTSILLYETNGQSGGVPAGWLYLIAYGTVCLLSLVHSAASFILDWRGGIHA